MNMSELLVVENFINGHFVSTKSHIDSFDPSTGSVWAKIPDSEEKDVNKAVDAAKNAFPKYTNLVHIHVLPLILIPTNISPMTCPSSVNT